jgi:L-ribulokinase
MTTAYTIGLDFGTNSVRALVVDVRSGREIAASVWDYEHGEAGVVIDPRNADLARQHPADYLKGIEKTVTVAVAKAASNADFSPGRVIGIGVDTTGSTPLPVGAAGHALALTAEFENDPNAMAWLWKDHTSHAHAERITELAAKHRPHYLAKCGGRYSSEWFWSKIAQCAVTSPKVFAAAHSWVEITDWIPAILTDNTAIAELKRGVCAAGHKAFYSKAWGGYPDAEFLALIHPELPRLRGTLGEQCANVSESAGGLSDAWAKELGLTAGIPVAVGAFDAHLGAVGAGIADGTLVKIMGTSTCDIMVAPLASKLADIPGLCGIVSESVLPGYFGLEAGQSAVGDIFNWFVGRIRPGGDSAAAHEHLTADAAKLKPGESGLLALDWHNGNRTVLVDQRLTGLLVGMSLHTTPAEIYRALIEATAFGARVIMERFQEHNVPVKRVINCGGIAARNPLAMQIYADVMNRPLMISRSTQTCALGSAIAGAVVAGAQKGGYDDFKTAVSAMTGVQDNVYKPNSDNVAVYERLYKQYRKLHDAFGIAGQSADLSGCMKELLAIRDSVRGHS